MEMNGSCIEGLGGKVYRTFCIVDRTGTKYLEKTVGKSRYSRIMRQRGKAVKETKEVLIVVMAMLSRELRENYQCRDKLRQIAV